MNKIKTRHSPGTKILGVPGIKEIKMILVAFPYVSFLSSAPSVRDCLQNLLALNQLYF